MYHTTFSTINIHIIPSTDNCLFETTHIYNSNSTACCNGCLLYTSYWQVPLAEVSRKYTAFLFNGKNYQFWRLPFGLNTSVASFIKCLDKILRPKDLDFLTLYVDDILIASRTFEDHLDHLRYVLAKLETCLLYTSRCV